MSRVGIKPVEVPDGVTVTVVDGVLTAKGPQGENSVKLTEGIEATVAEDKVQVTRKSEIRELRAQHGLMRTLIANAITGAHAGFKKQLEINGVGYRAQLQGKTLVLSLGFSHDIKYEIPDSIDVAVEGNIVTVSGKDKELVGRVSSQIRGFRKPEPYKGKGIKYVGERIRRKAGKAAAAAGAE